MSEPVDDDEPLTAEWLIEHGVPRYDSWGISGVPKDWSDYQIRGCDWYVTFLSTGAIGLYSLSDAFPRKLNPTRGDIISLLKPHAGAETNE